MRPSLVLVGVAALATFSIPARASAQTRLSYSGAAGVSSAPTAESDRAIAGRGGFAQLSLGIAPRRLPGALRLDAMLVNWNSYAGPVSATANVVVPVGHIAWAAPYAIAGAGAYGVGGVGRVWGINIGAGVRTTTVRRAAFVEVRRHAAYPRTLVGLGVAFTP